MKASIVATAAVIVGVGVAIPGLAVSLAIVLTLALAVGLGASAFRAERATPSTVVTAFAPRPPVEPPTVETPDVTELVREVESSQGSLSPRIVAVVREIARGRLLDHHRLDLRRPDDTVRARQILGDDLAAIVLADDDRDISARSLPDVLTRLEQL